MPLTSRLRSAAGARAPRRTAPSCRGGASSLLRLAPPSAPRLPSPLDISGWVSRAAGALRLLPAVPAFPPFAASEFSAR